MAKRGVKAFFSFLMAGFLLTTVVGVSQTIVQWLHPEAGGWATQFASAQGGAWSAWAAMGLSALIGLVCLLYGLLTIRGHNTLTGVTSLVFAAAAFAAPQLGMPWMAIAAAGSFLLFLFSFLMTGILERRASMPKPAAPSKKAG